MRRRQRVASTSPDDPMSASPRRPATTRGPVAWAAVTTVRQIGPRWHRPATGTASRTAHEARDRPDRIDYPKLTRMAKWMYLTGWYATNAADRPRVDPGA